MSRCLIDIKEEVDLVRQYSDHLDPEKIKVYEARYDEIIEYGLERNPPPQKEPGKTGQSQTISAQKSTRLYSWVYHHSAEERVPCP